MTALPAAWVQGIASGHPAAETARNGWPSHHQMQEWFSALDENEPCRIVSARLSRVVDELATGKSRHDVAVRATMAIAHLATEGHRGASTALAEFGRAWSAAVLAPGAGQRTEEEAAAEWRRLLVGAVGVLSAGGAPALGALSDPCSDPFSGILAPEGRLAENVAAGTDPAAPSPAPDPDVSAPDDDAYARAVAVELFRQRVRAEAAQRLNAGTRAIAPEPVPLPALLAEQDEPIPFRVRGLLPKGGRVVFAAQRKAGKTTMVLNLVRCLADGGKFLGEFDVETPGGRIVILDFEMDRRPLRRWMRDQAIKNPERVTAWIWRGRASAFDILDPAIRNRIASQLRDMRCAVLIVDCLRPILDSLALSEDKDAGRFLVALDALLDEAGIGEAVLVHHAGHSGERSRGDSRLRDWPDAEWRLVREDAEPGREPGAEARRYFAAEGRDVAVPEGLLTFDPESRRLSLVGGNRENTKAAEHVPAVLAFVAECKTAPSKRGVLEHFRDNTEISQKSIRRATDWAIENDKLTVTKGQRRADLLSLTAQPPAIEGES